MTELYFLASNKRINLEEARKNKLVLEKADAYWREPLQTIFSLPYMYTMRSFDKAAFVQFLICAFEIGDMFELFEVHNQNRLQQEITKMLYQPAHIHINIGAMMYKTNYETITLSQSTLQQFLQNRTLIHPHGVTTIENYPLS